MKLLASRRGLEEKILIFIVLAAGLFGLGVLLHGAGYVDFSGIERATGAAAVTGFATGDFGTQEEAFSAEPVPNQPPVYAGGSLTTQQGVPLAIDLAALFTDPENDALTFLTTSEDVIDVAIDGSIATFTPVSGFAGERTLTIIASDGVNLLREPVKFVVEGSVPEEPVIDNLTAAPSEEQVIDNLTAAPLEEPIADNLTALPIENNATPENASLSENATAPEPGFATQDVITNCNPGPVVMNTSTTLTNSISSNGTCIVFGANNAVLDCDGFTISGNNTGTGVNVNASVNATVRDCVIARFATGIALAGAANGTFVNNTIVGTNRTAPVLESSPGGTNLFDKNESLAIATNGIQYRSNLTVSGIAGSTSQVRVSFHLNHTFDGDLRIFLTSPDNTVVELTTGNGGSGDNYGTGCTPISSRTLFDQYAATLITSGAAPFAGTFRPEGLLQTLENKSASVVNGVWVLNITDSASGDTGTLGCWSLYFNISTFNESLARGFRLQANATNNTFENNSATGNLTISVDIESSLNNSFSNTLLETAARWLRVDGTSANNTFQNTTFNQPNGSIVVLPAVVAPAVNVTIADLNVSFNRAFLNSVTHGFLNVTGIITLRNLTFVDPSPTVDFENDGTFIECTPTTNPFCTEFSYAGGVFVYNASHFTMFSSTGVDVTSVVLNKNDTPDPVEVLSLLNYTIKLNVSGNNASNTTLTDIYPPEVVFNSSQPAPLAGTNDTFILGNITNGTVVFVNITVFVLNITNNTVINNTANISFHNEAGALVAMNATTNTTVFLPQAVFNVSNIIVTKIDGPDPVENGTPLTYLLVLNSSGNGTAYNVTVNDTYPNEVVFDSAQPTPITGTNNSFFFSSIRNRTIVQVNITVNVTQLPNNTVLNNTVNVTFLNETGALLSATDAESTTTTSIDQESLVMGCPVTINISSVLTQNINSSIDCVTFGASNIILDCAGFTITYGFNNTAPASGIVARNRANITIVSCTVRDINATAGTSPAINLSNVSNSFVVNNTLLSNGTLDNYGIVMQFGSSYNTVANNTIFARGTSSAQYGVRVFTNATNNTIANNTIVVNGTANNYGVYMSVFTQNNSILNNTITADASSSGGQGIRLETSANNNLIANNTIVTRRPGGSTNPGIFLFTATSNNVIINNSIRTNGTSNNGGITLSTTAQNNTVAYNFIMTGGSASDNTGIQLTTNANNNTIANNIVFTSGTVADDGVRIITTSNNNRIENNTLNTNGTSTFNRGIYVNSIIFNTSIVNNTITTGGVSSNDGIRLDTTVINTTIINNTIIARGSAGTNAGISLLTRTNESTIRNNTIFTNGTTTNYGIIIQSLSINNTIAGNRINTSGTTTINYGIYLFTNADNNTIDNNTIIATGTGQSHGIRLETSSNSNRFFNNNISTNDTGYAVFILNSNDTSFVNTRFSNASNWTSTSANSARNNFTNTTFEEGNRRLTYSETIVITGAQDITKHRLSLANNRVFLNATNLTLLNRSAEIAFISQPFDDPQVLIDREDDGSFIHCLFGICNETSYANGEFVFAVAGFTTYSTAEGNVTLVKTDSIDPAVPGELLTYQITVEVSGNNASNATITDLYSPHVAFNTSEPAPLAGTNDTFILGNLTSGDTRVVNITVLVLNGSLNGVVINNTVNISYQNSTGNTVSFNTTENTTLVTGCPGTITSNTVLGQNVSSSGNCVTFGADNIFLDCAGFTIRYALAGVNDSSGINITSRNNTEVRNCVIVKGGIAGSRTHAIGIFNSSNTIIENNTIRTNGTAESDGIHSGVANSSEIVFTPAAVNIVTNNNNVNSPYCTNASGVSACQVCFDTAGVNCAFLGQGGCTDGEGYKSDVILRFNVSNSTNVTGGNIQIIGGESVLCDLNDVRILTLGTRNNCGSFRSTDINVSAFVTGPNNLTCYVAGGGKDEDNGFKLVSFSYDAIVTTSQSLLSGNSTRVTVRNNTIVADSATKARGIFLDAPGSLVTLNNVTNVGGDQSHGVVMGGDNSSVTDNNITTYQGNGSNAVFVFAKNVTVTGNRIRASGDLQSNGILVLANDSVVAFNNISTTVGRENRGISILASNANITANNISVNALNESHGIFVGGSNNTIERNNVTLNTSGLSHGIFLEGGSVLGNFIANNTIDVRGLGSDAIRIILSTRNTIADNQAINASLSAMRVDRALNNVIMGTLPAVLSSLLILENDGTINFTQPLTLTNATNLSQVVTIAFNFTRVNTTHSAGQQLNKSAILQIFGLPVMGFRPMVDFEDDNTFVDCNSPQCRNATFNQTTAILQMNVSSFTTYAGRAFPDCTTIDNEENQTTVNFTLETNLTATNTCFEIFGENVTLNCDNYTIFYDSAGNGADGIEIYNTSGIVIKNCIIRDINRGGSFGIGINASIMLNHSEFFNNAIFTNGTFNNHGIALQGNTSNVTLRNNTIRTNGSSSSNFGIFMNGEADYVQILGNDIRTNGSVSSGDYGINGLTRRFFYGRIENNTVDAGSVETGGSNFGITIDRMNHTIVQGNYINTSPASNASGSNFGLVIFDGNNNTIQRNTIVTSGESSSFVIFMDGGSDYNTIMHNLVVGTTGDDHFGIFFDEANTGNIIVNNTINLSDTDDNFGILMEPANDTLIENNTIITCCTLSNYGIIITDSLGSRGHNITIKNNNISVCCTTDNEGVIIEVDNSTVSNNTVTTCCSDSFNPGIWVRGGDTVITGNVVRTNGTDGNEGILQDVGTSNVRVAFNDVVTHGTDVFNPGIDVSGDNALIAWNNVSTNGTGENYGILAVGSNTTIANNIVNAFNTNDVDGDGIYFGASYGNATIVNNTVTVYGNRSTGIFIDSLFLINDGVSVALRRANMTNITITNNTISAGGLGTESHGILISGGVSQSTVRDNRILAENNTFSHGIFLFDNVTENSIENNVISAFSNESYAVFMLGGPLTGFGFNDTFEDGTLSPFITYGDANWSVTPESALNSTFGVRAGNMSVSGHQSHLEANITLPTSGTTYILQFALNQTVDGSDRTEFYLDNAFQTSYSTSLNWTRITRQLTSGRHTVRWTFRKFTGASTNYAFIDNIQTLPLEPARNNSFVNNTLRGTHWIYLPEGNANNTLTDTLFDEPNGSVRVLPTFTLPNAFFNASKGKLNVTFNRAFMNSSNLSVMNLTSRITLLGIAFPNPTPLFDFEDDGTFATCTSTADPFCTELSYSGGAFVYNASHFTTFSSEDQGGTSITLTKRDNPDPVNASTQLNYTVVVNVTSGNASNLTLTDVYPPQVIFLTAQPTPLAGTNNTFILGNFTNGTAVEVNITVLVLNISNGTVINNTANISFNNQSGSLLNQSVTEGTVVLAPVSAAVQFNLSNVSIVKLDSPDPVNASSNLSYTIVVNATADSPANVTLTDIYPPQVIFLTAQPTPITGTNNTFIVGNLTNGTSFSVNITVLVLNVTNGTVINNTANITFQNQTGATVALNATQSTTVLFAAAAVQFNTSNITVSKADLQDPVENNTQLNYTITVTSSGNGTAFNVTVNDTYPAQVVFNSAQPTPITGTNNTFILGNLSAGTVVVINITVNVTAGLANGTVINNTVNVTFQNETSASLSATDAETTTVQNESTVGGAPAPAPSPGQGGGSGGSRGIEVRPPTVEAPAVCLENWACEGWSSCSGGVQSRACYDVNQCNSTRFVPVTRRTCVPEPVSAGESPRVMLQRLIAYVDPFPVSLWLVVFVILGIVFLTMTSWKLGQHRGGPQYLPPAARVPPIVQSPRKPEQPRLSNYLRRVYGALDSGEEEAKRFEDKYAAEQERERREDDRSSERERARDAREEHRRELREQRRLEVERRRALREEQRQLSAKPAVKPAPVKLAPLPQLAPVKAQKAVPVRAPEVQRSYLSIVDKYLGKKDTKLKDVLDKAERTFAEKKEYGGTSKDMQQILRKLDGIDSMLGRFKKKFRK